MKSIDLSKLLGEPDADKAEAVRLFATLNLGVVELLANGALSSAAATPFFYNAANCLHVRKKMRDKTADAIMSHGVQLQDLFESLSEREAQQEFQRELAAIRALCLQLLDQHELVA